jgi:hypothetical protein
LPEALSEVVRIAPAVGLDLQGSTVILDSLYECRANRKAIFNRGMIPNVNPSGRQKATQARTQAAV